MTLAAAVLLYLVLGVLLFQANRHAWEFRERALKLDQTLDDLRLQVGVMTYQSLLSAATGERRFTTAHGEALKKARDDWKRLHGLCRQQLTLFSPLGALKAQFQQLTTEQTQVLDLVAAGRTKAAWSLLQRHDYEAGVQALLTGLDALDRAVESWTDATRSRQRRSIDVAVWCIAIFTPLFVLVSLVLLRSAKNNIVAIERAQRTLTENARTMEALLDATSDRVIMLDRTGRVRSINAAAAKALGREATTVLGKTLFDLYPKALAQSRFTHLLEALERGTSLRFSDERGGVVLDHTITPLPDAQGNLQGVALFARDITAIARAREEAEASNRAKSEFLANISHEVRTPLNGIVGMVQILAGNDLTGESRECLADIETAAGALLALISDIIELSSIEAGKLTLEHMPFVPHSIMQSLEAMFRLPAQSKGLTLTIDLADDVPELLMGDGNQLRRVLKHLLDNAFKFTQAGGVCLSVRRQEDTSEAGTADGSVRLLFSVADTGIGIAAKDLGRIFERFAQADGSATRRFGGTGLGLSIASRLVECMGGTIRVASAPGQGSTFAFALRFDRCPDPERMSPPSAASRLSP